jgi:diguanylate cyclase (GGDEF)-like protein
VGLKRRQLIIGAIALQSLQLLVFVFLKDAKIASNSIQVLIGLTTLMVCLHRWRSDPSPFAPLWLQLSGAVLLWTAAQIAFLVSLFNPFSLWESAYNTLWLLFPFPLILVASRFPDSAKQDATSWLDLAQECLFFATLFALIFSHPAILSIDQAYEVQSVALGLAFALRFSMIKGNREKAFFSDITLFALLYAFFSTFGTIAEKHGFPSGSIVDVCWVIPFTTFSCMAMRKCRPTVELRHETWIANPVHLHGVSALGLAAMSVGASSLLLIHGHVYGAGILLLALVLLAMRINLREWQSHRFRLQLEHAVMQDSLTRLGNRAMLQSALSRSLDENPEKEHLQTAVLFIDVDRFKAINEEFGHSVGDKLLIEVARVLRSTVRSQDTVARHGGDKFVILLYRTHLEGAHALAEKLLKNLRTTILLDQRTVPITASIGMAMGRFGDDADALLQKADCAMYAAKQAGKDQLQVFTADMMTTIRLKSALVSDLQAALRQETFEVHYQPIYSVGKMQLKGFEALARWSHPVRGKISPVEFIPIAEETGLIKELGRQVLRAACSQCHAWNQRFNTSVSISVNVSAHQFADPDLLITISNILTESMLNPSLLKLEITESVLLSGYDHVGETLTALRALGIVICLDDFGTGYSSLSYLLNFPIDVVKIDKSFVAQLDREYARAEVVRSVIQLTKKLGMEVIAEGVETVEELRFLGECDCEMVQGYLLSMPLATDSVERLMDEGRDLRFLSIA